MSREGFAQVLQRVKSPAAIAAGGCYDAIARRGADPATGLGFYQHESTYGTKGRARRTHGWGNQKIGSGWALREGYADDVDEKGFLVFRPRPGEVEGGEWIRSAECWAVLVMDKYSVKEIEQITPFYAPAGPPDFNQPTRYASAVIEAVTEWAKLYPAEDEVTRLRREIAELEAQLKARWARLIELVPSEARTLPPSGDVRETVTNPILWAGPAGHA
jgi:hypothetical protein